MPILGSFAGISAKAYGLTSNLVGDYFFIAESNSPSGAVASLDFSSVPQQYTHLEIRMVTSNSASASIQVGMRFNGDTGATQYSSIFSFWDGTTTSTTSSTGSSSLPVGQHTTTSTNRFSVSTIQIQNYANTNIFKNITFHSYMATTGTQQFQIGVGNYKSGSAITSISLFPRTSNFKQFSAAYLYGIK